MRSKAKVIAVALISLVAPAVAGAFPPTTASIGAFFTPSPSDSVYSRVINATPFAPFDIYLLSYAVPIGMEAYEFSVQMPASALVGGGRVLPEHAFDFGAGDDNWIVGTGGICRGGLDWFTLVHYAGTLLFAAGNDLPVCVAGASPTSFPGGEPGYLVCVSPGDLRVFARAYVGCAVINCTQGWCIHEPIDASSFGALKAAY